MGRRDRRQSRARARRRPRDPPPTSLEHWAHCPFRYFLARVLRLSDVSTTRGAPTAIAASSGARSSTTSSRSSCATHRRRRHPTQPWTPTTASGMAAIVEAPLRRPPRQRGITGRSVWWKLDRAAHPARARRALARDRRARARATFDGFPWAFELGFGDGRCAHPSTIDVGDGAAGEVPRPHRPRRPVARRVARLRLRLQDRHAQRPLRAIARRPGDARAAAPAGDLRDRGRSAGGHPRRRGRRALLVHPSEATTQFARVRPRRRGASGSSRSSRTIVARDRRGQLPDVPGWRTWDPRSRRELVVVHVLRVRPALPRRPRAPRSSASRTTDAADRYVDLAVRGRRGRATRSRR